MLLEAEQRHTNARFEARHQPNFLIAGAGESGTSWLSACLLAHPQIHMPQEMRPEPHFFYKSHEYAKGFAYYRERYFSNVPNSAIAIGERSSSYIFGEQAVERMARALPHANIIVMLREPVQRAYSNWRFTVQSGLETESFENAIALEKKRLQRERNPFWREIQPYAYVGRSRYGEQIEQLMRFYPREQVLILQSEVVKKDEPAALRRVCDFLGVDTHFSFPSPGTFPTSSVKNRRLQSLLRKIYGHHFDQAIENTRVTNPDRQACKPAIDWLLKLNLTNRHPTLKESTSQALREKFQESNQRLAPFVDWDPLNW